MPVFTVKEIADSCSMEPKNIHTYISRKKLVKRKDGLIDDSNPINKLFLQEHQVWPVDKTLEQPKDKNKQTDTKVRQLNVKPPKSPPDDGLASEVLRTITTDNELKKLKAEKMQMEIEILKLKKSIQSGKMIPLSAAENVVSVHFNSITSVFYSAVDNEISDICNELSLPREKLSSLRARLKKIINDNVVKSKGKSKKDLTAAAENNDVEIEPEKLEENE